MRNVLYANRQPEEAGAAPPPLAQVFALPPAAETLLRELRAHWAMDGAAVYSRP